MNRHTRRRAAALKRGRRTGYLHRIISAVGQEPAVGVHLYNIAHDTGCSIYVGQGCNCVPDITVSGPDGITVIDEHGVGTKQVKQ